MGRSPLYVQIAGELASRIGAGRYPMGGFLPVEDQLCTEFKVSHHTVREALRLLIERGLVLRRAGSGTRVIATQEPTVFSHVAADLRHVLAFHVAYQGLIQGIRRWRRRRSSRADGAAILLPGRACRGRGLRPVPRRVCDVFPLSAM